MSVKKAINKDGVSYRVRVDLGYHPVSGKRQQRMRTVGTKKEGDALERQWLTEIERGTAVDTSKMVVRELAEGWLSMMEKRGNIASTTFADYRYTVNKYIVPALGSFAIQRLTVAQVQQTYDDLSDHPRTGRKTHLRLKQMLDYARRQQWVIRNVCEDADAPGAKAKERTTWTAGEAQAFLHIAEQGDGVPGKCDYYNPVWRLALSTGMRRGELLGLRWRDLDFVKGTLSVRQSVVAIDGKPIIKDVKTAMSRRTIPLPIETLTALKEHRRRQSAERLVAGPGWCDHDLVFATPEGKPIDPNHLKRNFATLIKRAKVPLICIHELRHTHATLLFEQGVNAKVISERLGHADIGITLGIYGHVLPNMQEQAVTILDDLFGT